MKWARAWLILVSFSIIFAPLFFQGLSEKIDLVHSLSVPSIHHVFGTDSLGRDLLARVVCGARVSVGIGVLAVALSFVLGVFMGSVAGFFGGWVDRMVMILSDTLLCFPTFFLILAVVSILGPGIGPIVVILGVTGWMVTARLVRAEILSLKHREFVMSSRGFGAGFSWILRKHLLPNALGPALSHAMLGVSAAILTETGLSFLGIGVQPPTPSWGNILMDGKSVLGVAWWVIFFPGVAIFLTTLSATVLGESYLKKIKEISL